jgi:hypothetical protein
MDPSGFVRDIAPIMDYGDSPPDFDYTAFLQDRELEYVAEDSSSNSNSAFPIEPFSDGSRPTVPPSSKKASNKKQRLERRGHTKSRRGCYNCKRRRIKVVPSRVRTKSCNPLTMAQCQETHPTCGHCSKTGLQCEYPAVPQIIHQVRCEVPDKVSRAKPV